MTDAELFEQVVRSDPTLTELFAVEEEEASEPETENPYPYGTQAAGAWDARHRTRYREPMFGDPIEDED